MIRIFSRAVFVLITSAALWLTGCASHKPAAERLHERGWIGGEYKKVIKPWWLGESDAINGWPGNLKVEPKVGMLLTALSTNTPVHLAGLREGDLILQLNHNPLTDRPAFYEKIYGAKPGAMLPVEFYRNGTVMETNVCVGRELFRHSGVFAIGLPPFIYPLDLWPNPGFSLAVLGFEPENGHTELGSVKTAFQRRCDPNYHPVDTTWRAWLVIFQVLHQKTIFSQQLVVSGK